MPSAVATPSLPNSSVFTLSTGGCRAGSEGCRAGSEGCKVGSEGCTVDSEGCTGCEGCTMSEGWTTEGMSSASVCAPITTWTLSLGMRRIKVRVEQSPWCERGTEEERKEE